jgi:hypothetical protein
MAYPICCKYPSHPPADGPSIAKGSARHCFVLNVTVCALLLFTWFLVRSPAVTAYCCNPRIAATGDESNALITTQSLTLMEALQLVCTSRHHHDTPLVTHGRKGTLQVSTGLLGNLWRYIQMLLCKCMGNIILKLKTQDCF